MAAVASSCPAFRSSVANIDAARIGPTVCELLGPMPILKTSNTLTGITRLYAALEPAHGTRPVTSGGETAPGHRERQSVAAFGFYVRSARIGSRDEARRAGSQPAGNATARSTAEAPTNERTSKGATP